MNKLMAGVLAVSVMGGAGVVNAAGIKNTFSLGYAYTDLGGALSGNAGGANLKYNLEDFDSGFGFVGSLTYTGADVNNQYGYRAGKVEYTSFLVGPSWRFNDYLNAYVMAGLGHGRIEDNWGYSEDKTSFAYGAGFQVNPVENIAINASYEHTRFSGNNASINAGTWVLGVGYSF